MLEMWPDLVAVEMEAWGVVEAVRDAQERNRPTGFSMIRGISDRPLREPDSTTTMKGANADERVRWKSYAAKVAAAYTRHLIETSWPYPPYT